jgi:hypothetical protein
MNAVRKLLLVSYFGDHKNVLSIIPSDWVVNMKTKAPFNTFAFYSPKCKDVKVPSKSFLKTLIEYDFHNKVEDFVYKAKVLHFFGKCNINKHVLR